jgi:hypothetical protein
MARAVDLPDGVVSLADLVTVVLNEIEERRRAAGCDGQ